MVILIEREDDIVGYDNVESFRVWKDLDGKTKIKMRFFNELENETKILEIKKFEVLHNGK